jgi:predicted nucleotidyltransferase
MTSAKEIIDFVDAVVAAESPARVILFGSYASGKATEDSDVDLLVVTNHRGRAEHEAARIRIAITAPFPMDLLVRKQSVINQRIKENDFFLREIIRDGLVLYAEDNPRMGEQSRRRLRRRINAAPVAQA